MSTDSKSLIVTGYANKLVIDANVRHIAVVGSDRAFRYVHGVADGDDEYKLTRAVCYPPERAYVRGKDKANVLTILHWSRARYTRGLSPDMVVIEATDTVIDPDLTAVIASGKCNVFSLNKQAKTI